MNEGQWLSDENMNHVRRFPFACRIKVERSLEHYLLLTMRETLTDISTHPLEICIDITAHHPIYEID